MNLPISWVATAALPASQAVRQVASSAAKSANHFFGNLLPSKTAATDNGPSAPTDTSSQQLTSSKPSWNDRLESVRSFLQKIVSEAKGKYGVSTVSQTDRIAVEANGTDAPKVIGPEPIRSEIEQELAARPDLASEITSLASTKSSSEPLRWMPNQVGDSSADQPLRIWLDDAKFV